MPRSPSCALVTLCLVSSTFLTAAPSLGASVNRARWDAAAAAAADPVRPASRSAQASPGTMGGGFIEMVFGGPESAPAPGTIFRAAPRRGGAIYEPDYADPVQPAERADEVQGRLPARAMPVYGAGQVDPEMATARAREMDPRYLPQTVRYDGAERAGTIVIDTPGKFLYLVEGNGRALRYGIGVGRPGFTWAGVKTISMKRQWPDWRPPAEMLKRRPDLPAFMAGGPDNPLGARAMYLGSSLYRIHGSNEPWTIGTSVSSGCIRMRNEDVIDLYNRVPVGTKVVVI